jgi:hypothetical protein
VSPSRNEKKDLEKKLSKEKKTLFIGAGLICQEEEVLLISMSLIFVLLLDSEK